MFEQRGNSARVDAAICIYQADPREAIHLACEDAPTDATYMLSEPDRVPVLLPTLHLRALGNRVQIPTMYTDGRRRPVCEWHRGGDDPAPL